MNKSAQSKQGHQSKKKEKRSTYMRILRFCCCCCCFVLFLFSCFFFAFCYFYYFFVFVCGQLTGRAHNEVKQNEAMFNDEAGDLSGKKKGLWYCLLQKF